MLLIWSLYAWLFYQEFRRRRGPMLLIHHIGGSDPGAELLLINMSQGPVHVVCSLAVSDGRAVRLHDLDKRGGEETALAKEGPLNSCEYVRLGSFDRLLDELREVGDDGRARDMKRIDIRVAAVYGFHSSPVGARRGFRFQEREKIVLSAQPQTQQMTSYRQRQEVQRWLSLCRGFRISEVEGERQAERAPAGRR